MVTLGSVDIKLVCEHRSTENQGYAAKIVESSTDPNRS